MHRSFGLSPLESIVIRLCLMHLGVLAVGRFGHLRGSSLNGQKQRVSSSTSWGVIVLRLRSFYQLCWPLLYEGLSGGIPRYWCIAITRERFRWSTQDTAGYQG